MEYNEICQTISLLRNAMDKLEDGKAIQSYKMIEATIKYLETLK